MQYWWQVVGQKAVMVWLCAGVKRHFVMIGKDEGVGM